MISVGYLRLDRFFLFNGIICAFRKCKGNWTEWEVSDGSQDNFDSYFDTENVRDSKY